MATLKILVGIPASGKSSWAAEHTDSSTIWISSDNIRKELLGSEEDQSDNGRIFNEMFNRTVRGLVSGLDVIYDATNLVSKRREALIREVRKAVKNEILVYAYIFATPYTVCLERNNARPRKVPESAMERMYKQFQIPIIDEGFDSIFIIRNSSPTYSELDIKLSDSYSISQDNHHHTRTIGSHCNTASEYVLSNQKQIKKEVGFHGYFCIYEAARYHDIGKVFCKDFHNARGEVTEEAHFYCHENVGAYDYLSLCPGHMKSSALEIATLINYHMIFFKEENYRLKIKEKLGHAFYRMLEILHDADMAAH